MCPRFGDVRCAPGSAILWLTWVEKIRPDAMDSCQGATSVAPTSRSLRFRACFSRRHRFKRSAMCDVPQVRRCAMCPRFGDVRCAPGSAILWPNLGRQIRRRHIDSYQGATSVVRENYLLSGVVEYNSRNNSPEGAALVLAQDKRAGPPLRVVFARSGVGSAVLGAVKKLQPRSGDTAGMRTAW